MGNSVLVFVSHSSDDKQEYVEPIASDFPDYRAGEERHMLLQVNHVQQQLMIVPDDFVGADDRARR